MSHADKLGNFGLKPGEIDLEDGIEGHFEKIGALFHLVG